MLPEPENAVAPGPICLVSVCLFETLDRSTDHPSSRGGADDLAGSAIGVSHL
jgi:hypothetical protein